MPDWLPPLYDNPLAIDRGDGSWVWDVEGNRYLDCFGGVLTTMVGHANPAVAEAISDQAARLTHTSSLYVNRPTVELAEEIARLSGIPDARVFFTTSGSEANETALLLATALRGNNEVLALRNGYHGRSFTTQAVTGQRGWTSTTNSGLAVSFVHGGDRSRGTFRDLDDDAYVAACAADLRHVIDTATSGSPACLIFEPIQGVGGFATPPKGLFAAYAKVLGESGALLISDEVQTGWGRTGEHFWGYEAHGIVPDLVTFAKGTGNGVALAGVVGRAEVMNAIAAKSFSTFGGNPLVAAAGLATIRYVIDNDLQSNAAAQGSALREGLETLTAGREWVAEVRGRGLMQAIEVVAPVGGDPAPTLATAFIEECRDRGLLVGGGGLHGNVVRIAPMMTVTPEEIDVALHAMSGAVEAVDSNQLGEGR